MQFGSGVHIQHCLLATLYRTVNHISAENENLIEFVFIQQVLKCMFSGQKCPYKDTFYDFDQNRRNCHLEIDPRVVPVDRGT